jgi:formimidoylglutamate deiminase
MGCWMRIAARWVWTGTELLRDATVEFTDRIVDVTSRDVKSPVDLVLDSHLLMPGMVNAHSHAFQRGFRGQVQWADGDDDFWSWRDAMYALANRLDPDGVEAVSRLAFLEMAEAGFTSVGEFHYLHHDPEGRRYADPDELARRVIRAATDVGLRICLLRTMYAAAGIGVPLRADQLRFGDLHPDEPVAAVQRLRMNHDPLVTIGVAPHSVRAAPPGWLPSLASFDGPIHAHVAEQPGEVAACLAATGRSPVQVFVDAGLVDHRFTAVHLNHPSEGDVSRLARAQATVCACPSTELDLGDGWLPLDARRSVRLAIGTDSHARIDPFAEIRALELDGRGQAGRRNVLSPRGDRSGLAKRLLAAGSRGGARALDLAIGELFPGRLADLVALDLDRPAADGVPPLEAAAFAATPEWVSHSFVGGRPVIVDGGHPRRAEIRRAARAALGG